MVLLVLLVLKDQEATQVAKAKEEISDKCMKPYTLLICLINVFIYRGQFGTDGRYGIKGIVGDRGRKGERGPVAEWAEPGEEGILKF